MKRFISLVVCLLVVCGAAHADNKKRIDMNGLPEAARQFVGKHFGDRTVAAVVMEREFFKTSYEVIFDGGDKIEFDSKGAWTEIDCGSSIVPLSALPEGLYPAVRARYPKAAVVKVERDRKKYEVGLTNRVELEFDKKFNLLDEERD